MGLIANQMFAEWCHKLVRKLQERQRESVDKRQTSEKAAKKEKTERL